MDDDSLLDGLETEGGTPLCVAFLLFTKLSPTSWNIPPFQNMAAGVIIQ